MSDKIQHLQAIISQQKEEILILKSQLQSKNIIAATDDARNPNSLSLEEVERYSRQLILPEIGVSGQLALKEASVLVVGAGGLGCPVGLYLAASGIGKIGIVDYDFVEISNLHRQIAHTSSFIGFSKSHSLKCAIDKINPNTICTVYKLLLNSTNIKKIIELYGIIVDASDNVPTRYLLNDAAVLYKKPLVSGSALRFEGQLTVYNYLDGPCYRCLFPKPASRDAVTNCSEGGVLGVITGVIGCLQALEVIKLAVGLVPSYYKKLLIFDGLVGDFKVIKLRNKKPDCAVCGLEPSIKELLDYELFCNTSATDNLSISLLSDTQRISCMEYKKIVDECKKHLLVDVRPETEIDICSLPHSINIPLKEITNKVMLEKLQSAIQELGCDVSYAICRRGNDSQKAVIALQESIPNCAWFDVKGGLHAWHNEIDASFPKY